MTIREWLARASLDEIEQSLIVERKRVLELEQEGKERRRERDGLRQRVRELEAHVTALVGALRDIESIAWWDSVHAEPEPGEIWPDNLFTNGTAWAIRKAQRRARAALDMCTGYSDQPVSAPEVPDSQ